MVSFHMLYQRVISKRLRERERESKQAELLSVGVFPEMGYQELSV